MAERLHPLARRLKTELGIEDAEAENAARAVLELLNDMPAVTAVERDVDSMGGGVATSSLAASALAMARELDYPWNSATSKSMCARALTETMDRLRELAPPEKEKDGVDDLERKRAERRASRGSGAAS